MKILLLTYIQRLFQLNSLLNSKSLKSVLYIFFLLCLPRIFSAQEINDREKVIPATISVMGGAQIFSEDPGLNKQIIQKNINVEGIVSSYHLENGNKRFVVTDKGSKNKSIASEEQESLKVREQIISKETKQKLAEHEQAKRRFEDDKVANPVSHEHCFSSKNHPRSYAIQRIENHDHPKVFLSRYSNIAKLTLDYLHSNDYVFYNNRSLNHCFSKIFSVRPPPLSYFS